MLKFLSRLIALALVSCLVTHPAVATVCSPQHSVVEQRVDVDPLLFSQQAFSHRAVEFMKPLLGSTPKVITFQLLVLGVSSLAAHYGHPFFGSTLSLAAVLPAGKRYPTPESVQNELDRRSAEHLSNSAADLVNRPISEGGDASLYRAAKRFKINLFKKPHEKMGDEERRLPHAPYGKRYASEELVQNELERRAASDIRNNPTSVRKGGPLEDSNIALEDAAKEFGVTLPKMPGNYSTEEAVKSELERRFNLALPSYATFLQRRRQELGDFSLYSAALEFKVKLPRKPRRRPYDRQPEEFVYDGDKTTDELIRGSGSRLPNRHGAYRTKATVEAALAERERLGLKNDGTSLQRTRIDGGDQSLYYAALQFKIPLPKRPIGRHWDKDRALAYNSIPPSERALLIDPVSPRQEVREILAAYRLFQMSRAAALPKLRALSMDLKQARASLKQAAARVPASLDSSFASREKLSSEPSSSRKKPGRRLASAA